MTINNMLLIIMYERQEYKSDANFWEVHFKWNKKSRKEENFRVKKILQLI